MLKWKTNNFRPGSHSSTTLSPVATFILGVCMLTGGVIFGAYTYNYYQDWEVVEASYDEHNCEVKYEKARVKHEKTKVNHKKTKRVKYCDRTITYRYKGREYTREEKDQSTVFFSRQLVHPSDPSHSESNTLQYLFSIALVLFGLLCSVLGFKSLKNE